METLSGCDLRGAPLESFRFGASCLGFEVFTAWSFKAWSSSLGLFACASGGVEGQIPQQPLTVNPLAFPPLQPVSSKIGFAGQG